MEQAKSTRKLQIVRAIVRPDHREEYLARWAEFLRQVRALEAQAWLFEDEALPGRFVEFTEYAAAAGMEARLREARARAGVAEVCARRSGSQERYREVRIAEA